MIAKGAVVSGIIGERSIPTTLKPNEELKREKQVQLLWSLQPSIVTIGHCKAN